MANLTLRTVKGSALTYQELDNNFSNLDSDIQAIQSPTIPLDPKQITLVSPQVADNFTLGRYTEPRTITKLSSLIVGAGTSVRYSLYYDSDRTAPGTSVIVGGNSTSSKTFGDSDTTFDNPTVPQNAWFWIELDSVVGTINEFTLTIDWS